MIDGFPDSFQLGTMRLRIEQYDGDGGRGSAEIRMKERLIRVQTNWGTRTAAIALLHEILHGCWRGSPLIKAEAEGALVEEKVVEWLGFSLSAAMAANPQLFLWLIAVNVTDAPLRMQDLHVAVAADAPAQPVALGALL